MLLPKGRAEHGQVVGGREAERRPKRASDKLRKQRSKGPVVVIDNNRATAFEFEKKPVLHRVTENVVGLVLRREADT